MRNWGLCVMALLVLCANLAFAQDRRALARLDFEASHIREQGARIELLFALSQPVPFRPTVSADGLELAIEFRELAVDIALDPLVQTNRVIALESLSQDGGWSQLTARFDRPMSILSADLSVDDVLGTGELRVILEPGTPPSVQAQTATQVPQANQVADAGPLVVVLDPGHGGIDPGAQADGLVEANLMLNFARELREQLIRTGDFEVVLTREADVFVSLPARVSIARAAGADVFLSLHADALVEGRALGTSIYTLSEKASDAASAALAARQDRTDILAGVDLSAQDDEIAGVLMDLARRETKPRTNALADTIVTALEQNDIALYKRPRQQAGFSVLKAPDIPSLLIELGFLSSKTDRVRLVDPDWRARFAQALAEALSLWALEDAALSERLLR